MPRWPIPSGPVKPTAAQLAAWHAYWDWQDRADLVAGDPDECDCCLSVRAAGIASPATARCPAARGFDLRRVVAAR